MTLNEPVVRVHRTSRAGVVPAFNIEGQFEREARHNKEANEKVRTPASFLLGSVSLKRAPTAITPESFL